MCIYGESTVLTSRSVRKGLEIASNWVACALAAAVALPGDAGIAPRLAVLVTRIAEEHRAVL